MALGEQGPEVALHAVAEGAEKSFPIELLVVDDGIGTNAATLASTLTFGGSSRFDHRSSLGR